MSLLRWYPAPQARHGRDGELKFRFGCPPPPPPRRAKRLVSLATRWRLRPVGRFEIAAVEGADHTLGLARPLLITTISTMVLISIDPFAFKKTFLLVVALLGLSSALCFADPLFMSCQFGRHDRQSHRVSSAGSSASFQSQNGVFRPH